MSFKRFCETKFKPFLATLNEINVYLVIDDYIRSREGRYDVKKGLFIRGVIGCGKTLLMKNLQSYTGGGFKMINARELVLIAQGNKGNIDKYLVNDWCFDDLGTEDKANIFGKDVEVMVDIIELRYSKFVSNGLKTYFTTNLKNDQLKEKYGERAYDRIKDMCNVIVYPVNESKRGKSVFENNTKEEVKKEPTEGEQKAMILNFIEVDIIQKYEECLNEGVNIIDDRFGAIYKYLNDFGLIKKTTEERIELFEKIKKTISIDNPGDRNDRSEYRRFEEGEKKNKYYRECVLKCKSITTKEFIDECLEFEVDLRELIKPKLNIQQ